MVTYSEVDGGTLEPDFTQTISIEAVASEGQGHKLACSPGACHVSNFLLKLITISF